jgi:hypothetical protein
MTPDLALFGGSFVSLFQKNTQDFLGLRDALKKIHPACIFFTDAKGKGAAIEFNLSAQWFDSNRSAYPPRG